MQKRTEPVDAVKTINNNKHSSKHPNSQFMKTINERSSAKVLCVLYDDPVKGYPASYPRDEIPTLESYPDGQKLPTPNAIDFTPGELLGSVSGELGLRRFLESNGHRLVVTSDKDGPNSVFERELPDADIVISQPFWPAYLTAERIAKAPKLKLAITAGIGSDHVDLEAAIARGITVAEETYCNSISVAEHAVMQILALVRNYIPSYEWIIKKGWNIADCAERAYDLEGMNVGIVAAGRIGLAVLRRLKPFDVMLHYYSRHRLPENVETELGLTYHQDVESLARVCDVTSIHCPLTAQTEKMFNDELLGKMKRGSYIVNTARGAICDRDAIVRALESGQLAGYSGDVWFPQPPSEDHPWRTMPHHGLTPHVSGTTLSAQARYAAGVREILECWFAGQPIREEYLIVDGGKLAGTGAHSYTRGKIASIGNEQNTKTNNHNGSRSVKPKFRSNRARSVSLA
jgi:formate dehydrogenase